MLCQSRPHRTLASLLAAPVDTERPDRILLPIESGFAPVEDIVRRQMNKRRAALVASSRDVGCPRAVYRPSRFRFTFGAVDGRVGGKINRQIGFLPRQ